MPFYKMIACESTEVLSVKLSNMLKEGACVDQIQDLELELWSRESE